jgi:hypothetical protein
MARRRDDDEGGYPLFWLLLGFCCGVVATLGALLLLSGEPARPAPAVPAAAPPARPAPAPAPVVPSAPLVSPKPAPERRPDVASLQPRPAPPRLHVTPQHPAPRHPVVKPAARRVEPAERPAPRRSRDQIAEDAAAAGMTARTR